jgi:hypothetical protein
MRPDLLDHADLSAEDRTVVEEFRRGKLPDTIA